MRSPEIMPPTNARYANQPWADAACSQEYQAQRAAWSASPNSDNSDNAWNVFSFSNRAGKARMPPWRACSSSCAACAMERAQAKRIICS